MDAAQPWLSNATENSLNGALYVDSGEVPSASAVFSVAGVAPAPATDVAHLGATPWVTASGPPGHLLTS